MSDKPRRQSFWEVARELMNWGALGGALLGSYIVFFVQGEDLGKNLHIRLILVFMYAVVCGLVVAGARITPRKKNRKGSKDV